jgi:pimeloyl-ACP methyl ester carboxylesterase
MKLIELIRKMIIVAVATAISLATLPAIGSQTQVAPTMPPVEMVATNGIQLAVYEAGSGPAVVLLHGFPGVAYTWRHQIPALVDAGYRVIVPDLRGYGLSDRPQNVEEYDIAKLTGDVVGVLDSLNIEKAVFIGHDWGGLLAWQMALFYKERTNGVVSFNTPHIPHWGLWLHHDLVEPVLPEGEKFAFNPQRDPIEQMREIYSSNMYVLMFQDGDRADRAMNNDPYGTLRGALRKDLGTPDGWDQMPVEFKNMEYYGRPAPENFPGQDVLTAEELNFYVNQYAHTGFTPAINWYRNITRNWKAGLDVDQTIRVPSLMISAENDVVLRPSMTDEMDAYVPDLEKHIIADAWHWTPEEKPKEANQVILNWLQKRFPL